MRNLYYTGMFVLVLSLYSCANKPGMNSNPLFIDNADHDNKSIVYIGFLPCEDCGGLQTMIQLNEDSTYAMEFLSSDEIVRSSGKYIWKKGSIILKSPDTIAGPAGFKINDNKLIPLDSKESAGSEKYFLLKSEGILEVYWKLDELNGNSIVNVYDTREAHLVLKLLNNRIVGNGGCNGFGGKYELTKGNGIRISNLISTKMACVDITYESEFLNVLAKADNYLVRDDSLLLIKNDEVLARFVGK